MATTAKPKQKTRDELLKQLINAEMQGNLSKDQLAESRRRVDSLSITVTELRGIIAELEREKAMLQGYIERDLQDKRAISAGKASDMPQITVYPETSGFETKPHEVSPYSMPTLKTNAAGIDEKDNSGYGSTKRKPWYKI